MVEAWIIALAVWNGLVIGGAVWWLDRKVTDALDELDGNLAAAIKGVIEAAQGAMTNAEPFNPVQAAIAQWISASIDQKSNVIEAVITEKGPKGQFIKKDT